MKKFPYYQQKNNTLVAIKLKSIAEMDLDRHSCITISVQNLEEYYNSNAFSYSNKTPSEQLETMAQNMDINLSKGFPSEIKNRNSTITVNSPPAFQILYER